MTAPREIERRKNFDSGDVDCIRCGKRLHLYFNGGELDRRVCCGLTYRTEAIRTDLVIYDGIGQIPYSSENAA